MLKHTSSPAHAATRQLTTPSLSSPYPNPMTRHTDNKSSPIIPSTNENSPSYQRPFLHSSTSLGHKTDNTHALSDYDKQNHRPTAGNHQSQSHTREQNCPRNVDSIVSDFQKLMAEFDRKKSEIERTMSHSLQFKNRVQFQSSFPVITECVEETCEETCSSSGNKTHIPSRLELQCCPLSADHSHNQTDTYDPLRDYFSWKQSQKVIEREEPEVGCVAGGGEGDKGGEGDESRGMEVGELDRKKFPFVIIDLRLPDRSEKIVYILGESLTHFASSIVHKFSLLPQYTQYVSSVILEHLETLKTR